MEPKVSEKGQKGASTNKQADCRTGTTRMSPARKNPHLGWNPKPN
jgi:hypothetical protein